MCHQVTLQRTHVDLILGGLTLFCGIQSRLYCLNINSTTCGTLNRGSIEVTSSDLLDLDPDLKSRDWMGVSWSTLDTLIRYVDLCKVKLQPQGKN
ncbi:unnamed protein product [Allacma fusca]|uniref:Uncharacterized protein n=1 Tax=Allacma fusca TaxID=39272 RepID=A0A8J2NZE2_9HEXA|nr:unnamed protein product [Allacma fusca]